MSQIVEARALGKLKASMEARSRELREDIRAALLKSDSEQYLQIADAVRDLEDESFADLMVDVNLAEIDHHLDELRAIDAAMQRMSEGSYGRCEDCGRTIELERLHAAPFANRCFDCQSVHERTHYQKSGHTL